MDPTGLVTVRGRTDPLASKSGEDRSHRRSRRLRAEDPSDPARRPAQVDLDSIRTERRAQVTTEGRLPVMVSVRRSRRDEPLDNAWAAHNEEPAIHGRVRVDPTFEDLRHAVWAIWQPGPDAGVPAPNAARQALDER